MYISIGSTIGVFPFLSLPSRHRSGKITEGVPKHLLLTPYIYYYSSQALNPIKKGIYISPSSCFPPLSTLVLFFYLYWSPPGRGSGRTCSYTLFRFFFASSASVILSLFIFPRKLTDYSKPYRVFARCSLQNLNSSPPSYIISTLHTFVLLSA